MKRKHWLLGLLAVTVLAAAFMLGSSGSTPGVRGKDASALPQYNFVAQDVVLRQTGDDGQQQYQLEAARVEQQPEDRQVNATDLTVHYQATDAAAGATAGGQWTLTAARAELPEDNRLLKLRGTVQISGQPPAASAPVTVATESLDYDLKSQEATSVESVVLRMGAQQLQGTGLHANIRLGTFSLDSQVYGQFSR